jgi:hypothetical protein
MRKSALIEGLLRNVELAAEQQRAEASEGSQPQMLYHAAEGGCAKCASYRKAHVSGLSVARTVCCNATSIAP